MLLRGGFQHYTLYMLQRLNEQYPVLMALAQEPTLSKQASSTIKISFAFIFIPSTSSNILAAILINAIRVGTRRMNTQQRKTSLQRARIYCV